VTTDPAAAISAAVQRLDGVMITADLARLLVHHLNKYAELATARSGCAPLGVVETQHALARVIAGSSDLDSRMRAAEHAAADVVSSLVCEDRLMDIKAAAAVIGMDDTTVRRHCDRGRLGQKIGRDWVIRSSEVERFMRERDSGE
jgi:hypothetical protein